MLIYQRKEDQNQLLESLQTNHSDSQEAESKNDDDDGPVVKNKKQYSDFNTIVTVTTASLDTMESMAILQATADESSNDHSIKKKFSAGRRPEFKKKATKIQKAKSFRYESPALTKQRRTGPKDRRENKK